MWSHAVCSDLADRGDKIDPIHDWHLQWHVEGGDGGGTGDVGVGVGGDDGWEAVNVRLV